MLYNASIKKCILAFSLVVLMLIASCTTQPPDSLLEKYITIQSKEGKILYKSDTKFKDLIELYWKPIAKTEIKCKKSGDIYKFWFVATDNNESTLYITSDGVLKKAGSNGAEINDETTRSCEALHNYVMGLFRFDAVK